MAFKYRGGRTSEDVERRAKMSGGSFDGYLTSEAPFYKAKEGDNTIRIMPRTWDDEDKWGRGWEITVWLHRNVGPDNGTYLCLDKMKGEECPICQARLETTDDEEKDALRVQARTLAWIIDRNNEKAGPQIMGFPLTLFREINSRSRDKNEGLLLIDWNEDEDDEEKSGLGYDVMFTREGTDLRTKYVGVEIDREATYLHDDKKKQDRWLSFIEEHPLPDMLTYYDAEHIEKVLYGRKERRKADTDEEEDTRGSRRSRGRGREEEEPEERGRRAERRERSRKEEPEEEEAPKSRRSRRSEPEEEEETRPSTRTGRSSSRDEDEEEETPRRGGGVGRRKPAEDAEEDAEEEESASKKARGSLERLRSRR